MGCLGVLDGKWLFGGLLGGKWVVWVFGMVSGCGVVWNGK